MTQPARTILHGDLDAFYASVAQRDHPELRAKPVAIAFSSRRGVVASCSYEARAFGVRSAMPLFIAQQRCPDLIVQPSDFDAYHEASAAIHAIFRTVTDQIEPIALDEAFLDVTNVAPTIEAGVELARRFKQQVLERTALTLSFGVASNKLCAKIASGQSKPDGLLAVAAGGEAGFLAPLPVSKIWGIGPKTNTRLAEAGITTIGQLAALDDAQAATLFGRWGQELRAMAQGIDPRPIVSERDSRSVSNETTLDADLRLADIAGAATILNELAEAVAANLVAEGLLTKCVGVKVRSSDFQIYGRQWTLLAPTASSTVIYKAALACYRRWVAEMQAAGKPLRVRLLGVKAASLVARDAPHQPSLFR